MDTMQTVIDGLVAQFLSLSDTCKSLGNHERAAAYRVAAEDCRTVLTGSMGWQLDIQEKLKNLAKDC